MPKKLARWPAWAEKALQGVAFWIGHRRCLYRDYPLSEGALVAEICNLIHANLGANEYLLCEVMYTKLLEGKAYPAELTARARADLVIATAKTLDEDASAAKFIIEVKRYKAGKAQIDSDLKRLAAVRRTHGKIRAFMFVISEAELPPRFVSSEGKSILGKHPIDGGPSHFRVRRTLKAAHAFNVRTTAQYACLIEVYP